MKKIVVRDCDYCTGTPSLEDCEYCKELDSVCEYCGYCHECGYIKSGWD